MTSRFHTLFEAVSGLSDHSLKIYIGNGWKSKEINNFGESDTQIAESLIENIKL